MKKFILISLTSFCLANMALAVIFGEDSRIETKDAPELEKEIARSVPALVLKRALKKLPDGNFTLANSPLTKSMGFCESSRFSNQTQTANCSASLVAKDKVLTAAHCISEESRMSCSDYYIVFDYMKKETEEDSKIILKENVYECEKLLYNVFDLPHFAEDIAVIKLKKPVLDRKPIEIDYSDLQVQDQLFMIGYPLGIFQKVVTDGEVTKLEKDILSFRHTLDTFSVNSGGPVFRRSNGKQVGVLVRGSGTNYTSDNGCNDWTVGNEKDFADANSLQHMKKILNGEN